MPNTDGLEKHEQTSLRGIAKRAQTRKTHRFRDLYREINVVMLHACWQDLNKKAASGVDGVTAADYESNLESNIDDLVKRLKAKRYRAKLVRRHYIPKANGQKRPLGIPALEDKLVQLACSKLLTAIYEQDFLPMSYGYRPGRGARDAVADLSFNLQYGSFGYVVEADIKGFFDNLDHDWLMKMLEQRIDDRAFLGLIRKWLKAGILDTDGQIVSPLSGSPQGGIVSPILANIYLHYVLDLWFEKVVKKGSAGQVLMVRYADDFVCAFQFKNDAHRFFSELPGRLDKFGLQLAPEKTRILSFSRFNPGMKRRFNFLGFELFWFEDKQGRPRVFKRTSRKKLQESKRRIKQWIRANRSINGKLFIKGLNSRLRGHYNYFGFKGNMSSLYAFYRWATHCAFKWLNRRGGKRRSFTWEAFGPALERAKVSKPRAVTKVRQHLILA